MATGLHKKGFRAVVALMLIVSTWVFMTSGFAAHNPGTLDRIQAERHGVLTNQQTTDSHVHDDGSVEEQASGHIHGHNSGDHSHETAKAASSFKVIFMPEVGMHRATSDSSTPQGVISSLERPPKPIRHA